MHHNRSPCRAKMAVHNRPFCGESNSTTIGIVSSLGVRFGRHHPGSVPGRGSCREKRNLFRGYCTHGMSGLRGGPDCDHQRFGGRTSTGCGLNVKILSTTCRQHNVHRDCARWFSVRFQACKAGRVQTTRGPSYDEDIEVQGKHAPRRICALTAVSQYGLKRP